MFKKIKRFFWKKKYLKELQHDAFVMEARSEYEKITMGHLETLKAKDLEDQERITKEIAELTDQIPTLSGQVRYEEEKRKKDLEKELKHVEMKLKGRDRAMESVKDQADMLKMQSFEMQHRHDVFKQTFKP